MLRNGFLSLLIFLFSFPACLRADIDQPKITEVSGKVYVLRGGDASRSESAAVGLSLQPDDVVKTETDSYARIEMGAGNTVQVEADSELKIGSTPDGPKLNLRDGKLLNRLKNIPKDKKVQIGTPTSIAGIEGTTFGVSVAGNGTTEVDVLSGNVRVQSADEPNKFTTVAEMRRVRVSNWKDTYFVATGSGVAAEKYKRRNILEGGKEIFVVRADGMGAPAAGIETEQERRSSAEKAALDAARRELGERILRAKITEEESVADLAGKNKEIFNKIAGLAANAAVVKRNFRDDGSVEVEVEAAISGLNAAIGLPAPVFTSAVVQLGPQQYAQIFTVQGRLTAEQAAKTVADRDLLEQIQGILINSQTTIQDFSLRDDRVTGKVEGIIRGAETVGVMYFSDGTVEVTRRVKGSDVQIGISALTKKEILGIRYMGKPVDIEPTSYEALRRFEQ